MTAIDLLKRDSEYGYRELINSLEGVTEGQSWACMPSVGSDYLHTDGSIYGIVLHIASAKFAYGSISFRNMEIRWRDIANQMEAFEPSWEAAFDYLQRGHEYWMASWADIEDEEMIVTTNYTRDLPAWEMIRIVSQHDSYHAGQIALLRYGVRESSVPPPSSAEDIRKYCAESKAW